MKGFYFMNLKVKSDLFGVRLKETVSVITSDKMTIPDSQLYSLSDQVWIW